MHGYGFSARVRGAGVGGGDFEGGAGRGAEEEFFAGEAHEGVEGVPVFEERGAPVGERKGSRHYPAKERGEGEVSWVFFGGGEFVEGRRGSFGEGLTLSTWRYV